MRFHGSLTLIFLSGIAIADPELPRAAYQNALPDGTVYRDYSKMDLSRAHFEDSILAEAKTSLHGEPNYLTRFFGARLEKANFYNAMARGVLFQDTTLAGALFQNAILQRANFYGAHSNGDSPKTAPNFYGAQAEYAIFSAAVLPFANFQDAELYHAKFYNSHLEGASFFGADLGQTDLREAHLQGADLRAAILEGADLTGANLRGTDLRGAKFNQFTKLPITRLEASLRGMVYVEQSPALPPGVFRLTSARPETVVEYGEFGIRKFQCAHYRCVAVETQLGLTNAPRDAGAPK